MKPPTLSEWIAMAIMSLGLLAVIVALALQPPAKLPQENINICPLCVRPVTVHL